MSEVRRATAADTPALIELGRAMHAESPRYRDMPFSETRLQALAARLHSSGTLLVEEAALFIAEADGKPVGMAIVFIDEPLLSDAKFATDLVVYLKPEHRGGRLFLKLVRAFEAWAIQQGARQIVLGVSTGVHSEQTVNAYRRLGYQPAGNTCTKAFHGQ